MAQQSRFISKSDNVDYGRYVFFKNRIQQNKYPDCKYAPLAEAELQKVKTALTQHPQTKYDEEKDEHFSNINHYISLLESTANNLRANELDFLKEQNFPEGSKLEEIFKNIENDPSSIPYDQIIQAFNEVMQYDTRFIESMKEQIERTEQLNNSLKNTNQNELQELNKLQEEQYRSFVGKVYDKMAQQGIDTSKYKTNLTNRLAQKANSVLRGVAKNGIVIKAVTDSLQTNGQVDEMAVRDAILNTIMDTILDIKNADQDVDSLVNQITQKLNTNIDELINQTSDDEYARALVPVFKSIEEMALVKNRDLGKYLLELNDESIENLQENKHFSKKLVQKIFNLRKKYETMTEETEEFKKMKREVVREVRNAVQRRAKSALKTDKLKKMTYHEFVTKFKNIDNFMTTGRLSGGLTATLKSIEVKHSTIAEIITATENQKKIANVLGTQIGGQSITFKADVIINTGVANITAADFDGIDIDNIVNNVIKENCHDFFLRYQSSSGGQTNINKAKKAYKESIEQMRKNLHEQLTIQQNISEESEEYKKAMEDFQKTFSVSISIKDYDVYGNIFKFHGGSLGSKTVPQKVLENVYAMYETGGLKSLDVDALLLAVLNCGDAMIGSDLRPLLEHYILGAAALMMFDDSFTAIDGFFENAAAEFTGQRTVNLYRLNTKYVPASYVLDGIIQNLRSYYNDLQEESSLEYGKVTINNNFTSSDMTGSLEDMSKKALSGINISFAFMGGLFDTLERGPQMN